jgi:hypothetical protein
MVAAPSTFASSKAKTIFQMKATSIFFALLLTAVFAQAQTLEFGPKAGFQITSYSNVGDGAASLNWLAGAFGRMALPAGRLSLQAELLTSRQGVNDTDSDIYRERALQIALPVLAGYEVIEGLNVQAGLQPGFMAKATLIIDDDGFTERLDRTHKYNRFAMSLLLGAEYEAVENLRLGLRAAFGMTGIYEGYKEQRNTAVQVYAAYRLF